MIAKPLSLLYVTNSLNHHQLPLSQELSKQIGNGRFRLAITEGIREERQVLGWEDVHEPPDWVIQVYKNENSRQRYLKWFNEADVVITSILDFELLERRIKNSKLTMYMSERLWKPSFMNKDRNLFSLLFSLLNIDGGKARLLSPSFALKAYRLSNLSKNNSFHYLAIGSKASHDMSAISFFKNRTWSWAYFTEIMYPRIGSNTNMPINILWVGRMLKWKKLDTLIRALNILKNKRIDFRLTVIGLGPEKSFLVGLVNSFKLNKYVQFLDPVSPNEILIEMHRSDIYVLTSSASEGWGAVINEAMSCGCAVVASNTAGATEMIIDNGQNGFIYNEGDDIELSGIIEELINTPSTIQKISINAQRDIKLYWSPTVAASRLIELSTAILNKKEVPYYKKGPIVLQKTY